MFLLAEGRNITEKKRAEAEIARKNAELQSLLERVRQLDQLKSDLFANVSHELRTPLALILGPAEELLATGDNLTDRQRRDLSVIRRNAVALLKHVTDLLDLAKLDARKMALSYTQVDLVQLVRGVAEQFHAIAPPRDLSYVITTPTSIDAEVDAEKLERVLLNLLSNAFKFTPPGGRILCSLERTGSDRALLAVQDSGPGIVPALREAIFERFRQAQQGTTRDVGGTGLGLAISKEFVDLHHGTIGVSGAAGGGALFQVEIPLRAPPGAYVGRAQPSSASPARQVAGEGVVAELFAAEPDAPEERPGDDRPTVLVVEDNAEMRRFVREALAAECRVVSVDNGQLALECAIADPPDIVVTDLMLPKLGGDRLVDELRARPALAEVPVLVLSAKDDDVLRARLLVESVQDYVTKPFSAHELRARVRNLAMMKRARDAMRRELASQSQDLTQLTRQLIANRHALQESEQRWWAIYEHSPVGIALADSDGQIRTANPAFRGMLGYSADEMRACSLQRITPVEDRAATEDRVARLVKGEFRVYHLQRRFQCKDGRLVWANTSVSLIPAASDATRLLVVVAEDITERKRAEEALARAQNELARVARVSTLGELAASIAHEVNQPLAAIVANGHACVRWLDARPPDEQEAQAAARRIVRDANRASEVITGVRGFLKRGELQREAVALEPVIDDVLGLVRIEAQAARVTLRRTPTAGLAPVLADRVQVQQVVLNLVMNALEAIGRTAGGSRAIELSTRQIGPDAVRVDVRDTGPGIDPAVRDHVFDAFHTTKPEGMGMGLAISRSIVETHGGRIWVTPNEGPGVTFSFTLPIEPMTGPPP